jgi:hypothetical protein
MFFLCTSVLPIAKRNTGTIFTPIIVATEQVVRSDSIIANFTPPAFGVPEELK